MGKEGGEGGRGRVFGLNLRRGFWFVDWFAFVNWTGNAGLFG